MPHFCMDEVWMIMMMLPWMGGIFLWLKMKFRAWRKKPSPECETCQQHIHHPSCEYNAAMREDSHWAGNHAVSCTCEEEDRRDRQLAGGTYR